MSLLLNNLETCPRCGSSLGPDTPDGLCAPCLLESALTGLPEEETLQRQASGTFPTVLGDYELISEIARGGMGVVFRARQRSLNRIVAVKLILVGQWASPAQVERFQAEAAAAARLDHPNIVPIYEIGEANGQHFFSMKLIEGGPLTASGHAAEPLAGCYQPDDAAALVATIARAVHYAHQRGVLHRDLKPTNILLDAQGQPHLTDFGLAKVIERGSSLTHTAAVIGTPSYMAPEQGSGRTKNVTTAADIYSLGAILYELLAGQPPFTAQTPLEILELVRETEPQSLRSIRPGLSRDLETICLKCLAKEPDRRYGSALALAEDLDRWRLGQPILARPILPLERLWLWARRKPVVAGLAATVVALVVATAIGSTIMSWHIAAARDEARQQAEENRQRVVRLDLAQGVAHLEKGEYLQALPWLGEALRLDAGSTLRETTHRLRLQAVLRQSPQLEQLWFQDNYVFHATFSPDGSRVAACADDGTARIWDVATGQPVTPPLVHSQGVLIHGSVVTASRVRHVAFDASGKRAVVSWNFSARVWDAETGKPIGHELAHSNYVFGFQFSPDGKLVLTASRDQTARLWDANTGEPVGQPMRHSDGIEWAVFGPDGQQIATAGLEGTVRLWSTASQQPVGSPLAHPKAVRCISFSPDGRRLVSGGDDLVARVWDVETQLPSAAPLQHQGEICAVAFSPDGRRIATASGDHTARVWDAETGQPVIPPLVHGAMVFRVNFSPNGKQLITGSHDGTARVWDSVSGAPVTAPLPHNHLVSHVSFHPDGGRVLTASHDGVVRLWKLPVDPGVPPLAFETEGQPLAFTSDGRLVLWAQSNGTARAWDVVLRQPITKTLNEGSVVQHAAFTPDGRQVLTIGSDGTNRLWDLAGSRESVPPWKAPVATAPPVFSPDAMRVVQSVECQMAGIRRVPGGQAVADWKHQTEFRATAFSPDGRWVASGADDGVILLREADSGREVAGGLRHEALIFSMNFSPDSRLLATASQDGVVKLWRVPEARLYTQPMRHPRAVLQLAFSRDGGQLLTASEDKQVRIWNVANGQLAAPPLVHELLISHISFNPDGSRVVTIDESLTPRVWDVATGQLVSLPGGWPTAENGSPSSGTNTWAWDWRGDDRPVEDLVRLTQLLSGRRMDGVSGVVPLDRAQLKDIWERLKTTQR